MKKVESEPGRQPQMKKKTRKNVPAWLDPERLLPPAADFSLLPYKTQFV